MKDSKKLLTWINNNYVFLSTLFLSIVISIINLKCGSIIMGTDNTSPWFNIESIISRLLNSENIFFYSGLIFSMPFTFLSKLGIQPWLISQIYYFLSIFIGLYFYSKIISKYLSSNSFIKKLTPLILISHLAFIWIFSQPTFLFLASFAGIASILYFLVTDKQEYKLLDRILLVIGGLFMAITVINPIAFIIYIAEMVYFSSIIQKHTTPHNLWTQIKKGTFFILAVFAIIQGVMLLRPNKNSIITEFINFSQIQKNSAISQKVTKSLRITETRNNAISSIIRFSGGWMELNGIDHKELFTYRNTYIKNPLFIAIGLFPVIILVFSAYKLNHKMNKRLFGLLLTMTIISSSYALRIYGAIPYISDITRWISSKTWPLLYLPLVFGYIISLNNIELAIKNRKVIFLSSIIILTLVYAFPIFSGQLLHKYAQVEIPPSYLELSELSEQNTIIIYPQPQKLFTRYYDWGYYGTDFIRYITPAHVIDRSQVGEEYIYDKYVVCIEEDTKNCGNFIKLDGEESNFSVYKFSN